MRVVFEALVSHLEEPLRAQNLARLVIVLHEHKKSSQSARFCLRKLENHLIIPAYMETP